MTPDAATTLHPVTHFLARLGHVHPSTVVRLILRGARTPDGRRLKLPAVRVGSRWMVSESAIGQYVADLTAAHQVEAIPGPRTPTARRKAADNAAAELAKKHGI